MRRGIKTLTSRKCCRKTIKKLIKFFTSLIMSVIDYSVASPAVIFHHFLKSLLSFAHSLTRSMMPMMLIELHLMLRRYWICIDYSPFSSNHLSYSWILFTSRKFFEAVPQPPSFSPPSFHSHSRLCNYAARSREKQFLHLHIRNMKESFTSTALCWVKLKTFIDIPSKHRKAEYKSVSRNNSVSNRMWICKISHVYDVQVLPSSQNDSSRVLNFTKCVYGKSQVECSRATSLHHRVDKCYNYVHVNMNSRRKSIETSVTVYSIYKFSLRC